MSKLTLDNIFGDSEFEYACPSCKKNFSIKIGQVSKNESVIFCPHCNAEITFVQDSKTKQSMKGMEKALKSLNKSIDSLGK